MLWVQSMSIEVQTELEIKGFAFDLNVACSSALFSLSMAKDFIGMGTARRVLVVNHEVCTGHLDYKDRDCHFIFGDTATARIVERLDEIKVSECFRVLSCRLAKEFSNNIRNNFGYLSPCHEQNKFAPDKLFKQNGRKVFREVVPMHRPK
jgi:beta-ketodecanoyl-[acyl-carrier-protein] synthase